MCNLTHSSTTLLAKLDYQSSVEGVSDNTCHVIIAMHHTKHTHAKTMSMHNPVNNDITTPSQHVHYTCTPEKRPHIKCY